MVNALKKERTADSLGLRRISTACGAEVSGIDLTSPLAATEIDALHRALGENGILLFRNADLTPDQHIAFSRQFGALEAHVIGDFALPGKPEIFVVSNVKEDGKLKGAVYAGQYWHSDLSYMKTPSMGSLLLCREMPDIGGDTLFANMYLAYDTLSASMSGISRHKRSEPIDGFFTYERSECQYWPA